MNLRMYYVRTYVVCMYIVYSMRAYLYVYMHAHIYIHTYACSHLRMFTLVLDQECSSAQKIGICGEKINIA